LDLQPKVTTLTYTKKRERKAEEPLYEESRLVVLEPEIQFVQTYRWIPMTERAGENRLKQTDIMDWNKDLGSIDMEIAYLTQHYGEAVLELDPHKFERKADPDVRAAIRHFNTIKLAKYKVRQLSDLGIFSVMSQSLPISMIKGDFEPPFYLNQIYPAELTLYTDGKKQILNKTAKLIFAGHQLNRIDIDTIQIVCGNAKMNEKAKIIDGNMHLEINVTGPESPVIFAYRLQGEKTDIKDRGRFTPPLNVKVAATP
jgi:hypothetical protein